MSNQPTNNNDEKMEAVAKARMLKTSPQKLNLVSKLIRNKPVNVALAQHDLDIEELIVSEAFVGKNLVLKRGRPRARGRYGKILKPFSQITIKVKQIINNKEEEKT